VIDHDDSATPRRETTFEEDLKRWMTEPEFENEYRRALAAASDVKAVVATYMTLARILVELHEDGYRWSYTADSTGYSLGSYEFAALLWDKLGGTLDADES